MDRRQFLSRSATIGFGGLSSALLAPADGLLSSGLDVRWSRRFDSLTPPAWGNVVVAGVGEVLLARSVYYDLPNDARTLLGLLADRGDVAAGNLSTTLSDWGLPERRDVVIAPGEVVDDLRASGFDVLSLANDNLLDTRARDGGIGDGLDQTLTTLHRVGIATVGGGRNREDATRAAVREVRDRKVAFLGFHTATEWDPERGPVAAGASAPGVAPVRAERLRTGYEPDDTGIVPLARDLERMESGIEDASGRADHVVVQLDCAWPLPETDRGPEVPPGLRLLAHRAVDAGADLVLGSGARRILPAERYADGLICYDLGTFFFHLFDDGEPAGRYGLFPETRARIRSYLDDPVHLESLVARAVFSDDGLRVDFVPFVHGPDGNPSLTDDERAGRILERFLEESRRRFGDPGLASDRWHAWTE